MQMIKTKRKCEKEGCSNPHFAKGFCKWHQSLREDFKKPDPKNYKIPQRSKKRVKLDSEYSQLKKIFMRKPENKYCPVMKHLKKGSIPAVDIHHKAGRKGKLLLYTPYWLAVSREGHVWIHDHPKEAYELGFLIPSTSAKI